jgi:hypothetical protein
MYMTDSQFDKLYKHMTERFDSLHDEVGEVKREVKGIYSHLDQIRALLDTDELERGAQSAQLARHETAIAQHDQKLSGLLHKRTA